ncbi:hypothetical protein KP509_24G035900 [Ceratopteris richardii]|uniref:Uncharacterized protein n=1 Tax=Ceratopteris richardii TaxID=49495 RepID=A0A8T2RWI6_CERRI|nr:hypothetical protein KP509_24G035900 [Ceratopteris richardii]
MAVQTAYTTTRKFSTSIKQALKWVKLPWQITGPTSLPDFKDSVVDAPYYRVFCPATAPKRAVVPHAEPDHVLNIAYFSRGRRAPHKVTTIVAADAEALKAEKEEALASLAERKFSPSYLRFGSIVPLEDCPGDGYQK